MGSGALSQLAAEDRQFTTIPWDDILGLDWLVIDLVTLPIFSAIAGVLTNWTGVIMLFSPVRFTGFYMPGLRTIFPFLPRKLQILPTFAPGGILGFQGFIPARAEKMASLCVDKAVLKIGGAKEFYQELDPRVIAEQVTAIVKPQLREVVEELMMREHPDLWRDLPKPIKSVVISRVDNELPSMIMSAFTQLGDNINDLIDVKLMVVSYLRQNPDLLKDIIYRMGKPELRFMTKIGLLGGPFGLILAIYLGLVHSNIPIIGAVPHWLAVLFGAMLIGIAVNVIAIKVVFEPGVPAPRRKYLWKQALLAKRQHEAAGEFGKSIGGQVITMPVIFNELLAGVRGDRTMGFIEAVMSKEIDRILGPGQSLIRVAVGSKEFQNIQAGTAQTATSFMPQLLENAEFTDRQSAKVEEFCQVKLRALPPDEFMDMLYSAVEQDAWLLYAHGGFLGIFVGVAHILLFGA